jgi:hypothetical protein
MTRVYFSRTNGGEISPATFSWEREGQKYSNHWSQLDPWTDLQPILIFPIPGPLLLLANTIPFLYSYITHTHRVASFSLTLIDPSPEHLTDMIIRISGRPHKSALQCREIFRLLLIYWRWYSPSCPLLFTDKGSRTPSMPGSPILLLDGQVNRPSPLRTDRHSHCTPR